MLKWLFRLFLGVVVLTIVGIIVFLLSYNTVLRNTVQHEIRAQTGMDADIGSLKVALASPIVKLKDIKINNPPAFGGVPLLNVPEIYIEYDRDALAKKQIHILLLRLNLAELDIVKNQKGETNIFSFGQLPERHGPARPLTAADIKKQTGYDFIGIDNLNVSIGKVRFVDLADSRNNREQIIGIENTVMKDIKSPSDLGGLVALIDLRSNHFFDPFLGSKNGLSGFLERLGIAF
ncbi:MAG TPA: AsmA family protein [Desulfuromonadaceae bacterium]|nr:AsmA family protein [Desulfuromonadaceae bacterium]